MEWEVITPIIISLFGVMIAIFMAFLSFMMFSFRLVEITMKALDRKNDSDKK